MKRADEMTVEEMAGVLGYTRDRDGDWLDEGGPVVCRWGDGRWASWPVGARANGQREHSSQHDALARLYALRFPDADATDEPDPEPAATLPMPTGGISARAKVVPIPPGATAAVLGIGPEGACLSFGFPETTGTPTPAPIVEPAPVTARESAVLETEPEGTRERWRFTVALAVVVDGRACIEFQRRITESALVALLTPRADRGDVLALARDCDDMERHCAYDRRTGRPFAFVERVA